VLIFQLKTAQKQLHFYLLQICLAFVVLCGTKSLWWFLARTLVFLLQEDYFDSHAGLTRII